MPSRRQGILEALLARVQRIERANEFQTDAGQRVYLGEAFELGPDDPVEAIALVVGEETPQYQGENLFITLPVAIIALAKADLEQPWLAVEAVIADIKTAVETTDRTLGGLVRRQIQRGPVVTLERQPGSTTVGASVTYLSPYVERWGAP
jgi:hypothetical protein